MDSQKYEIDEKYSLSIYHFNLQYVAGNVKTYHHLHKSSMKPFLRFFDENPQWCASCEIQGHYLKFMQKFYPEDLALLRKLNQREQIEMVSVHYSDQIYLAYPERDLQKSIEINDQIFKEVGLNRSGIWFGQENFFGQGIAERIMERNSYHTALVNHHLVWHHNHAKATTETAPYWRFNGVNHDRINFLISKGSFYEDSDKGIRIQQKFSYWNDAELAFGSTPYLPWLAKPEKQYREHLIKYKKLERDGWKIVKVKDYIDRVKELNLPSKEGPFLTDGTWNTRYYGGVFLWMGYYRLPWEKDAKLRSLTFRSRRELLICEKLVEWALSKNAINKKFANVMLQMAWKHQLLAEVSDSTGQQPFPVEIHYSKSECDAVFNYCAEIKKIIKSKLQIPNKYYNLHLNKFTSDECHHQILGKKVEYNEIRNFFPQPVTTTRIPKWKRKFNIYKVEDEFGADDRHFILDIKFRTNYTHFYKRIMAFFRDGRKNPQFAQKFDNKFANYAGINFPMWEKKVIYSPACMEDVLVEKDLAEFEFKRTWLPLPNGIIGLGNDVYIIKHNHFRKTHIACTLNFENDNMPLACFHVLNPYWFARFKWRYSIFKGSKDEVLKIADALNVHPTGRV